MAIKYMCLFVLFVLCVSLSAIDVGVKYDFIRQYHISSLDFLNDGYYDRKVIENDKFGYSFFLECPVVDYKYLKAGLGIEYQYPRTNTIISYSYNDWDYHYYVSRYNYYDYNFIPVYVTNRLNLPFSTVKLELLCNLGYNFYLSSNRLVDSDLEDGLYCGVGINLYYKNAFARIIYEVDNGIMDADTKEYKVRNEQIGLSLGLNLVKGSE